ncbi:beta strand repeat-containing protein, partial [Flavobacterium sp. RSSA_27]|uniref:beta strand repeat-containing protein n=1 Tax=Flavobacterium sp. RSSA_27 TaxID=3447667 RepID=UPI003F306FAF
MKKNLIFIAFLLLLSLSKVSGQTPGLIYSPASGAGKAVLDPNGDGYTSASSFGFVTDDQIESEIPYTSLVFPKVEPNSDLSAGPSCSFTDFVDQGDQDPVQSYIDASGNWLFRMRMGSSSPNSKSYSILIDTDGLFGGSGPNRDPQYSASNPGFEIEIVLATNFGVFVYDVNNNNCTPVISYAGTTNYQKSVALTTSCGNPDYFYDFYVKMSDLTSVFAATTPNPTTINATTPMRMAIVDNMGAQKSSVCNPSSASDVAGTDCNSGNLETCYTEIIDNYTPCKPGEVCPDRSVCPTINGPIVNGATTVSVTTNEAIGTIIKVYSGSTLIGTSSPTTTSPQTLTITIAAVATGDNIGATAQAPGEGVSIGNCDVEIVQNTLVVPCSSVSPTFSQQNGNQINVTTSQGIGTIIRLYEVGNSTPLAIITTTTTPQTVTFSTTGNGFNGRQLYATAEAPGSGCQSPPSNCTNSATPAITFTPLSTSTSSISGTGVTGSTIYLYANSVQIGTTTVVSGNWSIPVSGLVACQLITAQQTEPGKCISPLTSSVTVQGKASTPILNQTACIAASLNSVQVFSSEIGTNIIKLYSFNGSTYTPISGSSTNAGSVWTFIPTAPIASGTTIVARVEGVNCKANSDYSAPVTLSLSPSITTATTITGPVLENATTVSGTGVPGEWIQLYVDGAIPYLDLAQTLPIGRVQVSTAGNWSVTVNTNAIYLGAVLQVKTATASTGGCESALSTSSTIVQCVPPAIQTYSGGSKSYCNGQSGTIQLAASELGVIYELVNSTGVKVGPSVVGTGGAITLSTFALSSNLTGLYVKAYKLLNTSCSITSTVQINFDTQLPSPGINLTSTNVSVLRGTTTAAFTYSSPSNSPTNYSIDFSIAAQNQGFADVTSTPLSASPINVTVPTTAAIGTYNAILTITGGSSCSSTYPISITVYTATSPPVITLQPAPSIICSGAGTSFTVSATGTPTSYQWQVSTNGGGTYLPISNGGVYTTATTASDATLTISNGTGFNGYLYRVIVTNANGSVTSNPALLTVTPAVIINPFSPTTSTRCQGSGTETRTTTALNTTGITYNLDAASIIGGNSIDSVTGAVTYAAGWSGTTTITASAAGCGGPVTTTHVVTINSTPTAPTVGTIINPTCVVSTGSVELTGLPSTGTWTLTRMPGSVTSTGTGTSVTISGLNPGTYTYTVTNSFGCTSVASGNVLINAQPATPAEPTIETISPICSGTNAVFTIKGTAGNVVTYTGAISGTATIGAGGTVDVTVSGVIANTTLNITSISNGTCNRMLTASATVIINSIITLAVSSKTDAACFGASTGSVTA